MAALLASWAAFFVLIEAVDENAAHHPSVLLWGNGGIIMSSVLGGAEELTRSTISWGHKECEKQLMRDRPRTKHAKCIVAHTNESTAMSCGLRNNRLTTLYVIWQARCMPTGISINPC